MDLHPTLPRPGLFAQYRPAEDGYDECCTPDGTPRAVWKPVTEFLDHLGNAGVGACADEAARLVRESGANFRLISDAAEEARPWQLAIVPLVLDDASWSHLESGLQQRVRLLEAVLADLLGPQRLLAEHVLPAELLSANPEFVRAYHELPVIGHRLNLTATDLARDDDGNWWVTGDRTRAPSGLGFALENRIITSRVLSPLIRGSNVTRLASFFASLQGQLKSLAPRMRDNPRVAVLTPGQGSYRYVEDAYLARYLGFTLVQGRDLAVRGTCLHLKTLGGLLPIEVLWRHISDQKCDPLELSPHSTQGTVGMLRAIRAGSVAVANCIGSTLAQMPALLPFLPGACRFLFDEDLLLPSVATYWCGAAKECQYVLDHLDELVLRPAFAVTGDPPLVPAELSQSERASLIQRIRANPYQYVGQYRPRRSKTPVWYEGQLHQWYVALRSFHVQNGDGVDVLPGGLVRVSPDAAPLDHSPSSGRLGQDCWVISDQPVDHETTLLPSPDAAIRLVRGGAELPSRVAENLFWLGRYAERSESIARLLRTTLDRIAGENAVEDLPDLPRLIAALAAMGQIEPDHAIAEFGSAMPTLESVLPDSVFDASQPRGLQSSVKQMVEKAAAVRDRISMDAYRIIVRIGDDLAAAPPTSQRDMAATIEQLDQSITDLLAFSGVTNESTTRTHGWRFLQLGRQIERAYQTSELLAATLVQAIAGERPLIESVLSATDSLMTYRSRYLLQLQPVAAIDLLITDQSNPRSIAFQIQSINQLIAQLPTDRSEVGIGHDQRIAEEIQHRVRMSDPTVLATKASSSGRRTELEQFLQHLIDQLPNLSNAIAARYLIHTGVTQQLTGRADAEPPEAE